MTTSHTPGPWKAEEERGVPYLKIRGSKLGERFKIANVLEPVYEGSRQRESDETIANARLIAAAPELLEVLQMIVQLRPQLPMGVIEDAEAAIIKATGQAQ